jgi:hypothetical protein
LPLRNLDQAESGSMAMLAQRAMASVLPVAVRSPDSPRPLQGVQRRSSR